MHSRRVAVPSRSKRRELDRRRERSMCSWRLDWSVSRSRLQSLRDSMEPTSASSCNRKLRQPAKCQSASISFALTIPTARDKAFAKARLSTTSTSSTSDSSKQSDCKRRHSRCAGRSTLWVSRPMEKLGRRPCSMGGPSGRRGQGCVHGAPLAQGRFRSKTALETLFR